MIKPSRLPKKTIYGVFWIIVHILIIDNSYLVLEKLPNTNLCEYLFKTLLICAKAQWQFTNTCHLLVNVTNFCTRTSDILGSSYQEASSGTPLDQRSRRVDEGFRHFRLCCRSWMFVPNPNFFHPGSASKNLSILTQKIVSKLSEIWSGLFIPDPDPAFLPIPYPGYRVKKASDPGSGSATLIFTEHNKYITNVNYYLAMYLRHSDYTMTVNPQPQVTGYFF